MPTDGRPYNIEHATHLTADVRYVNCDEYEWFNEEIKRGIEEPDAERTAKWIKQGLDEHSSVATFAKFSIDLMSIGAPMWMVRLALAAGDDEIRHSRMSFDIANAYSSDAMCAMAGSFPKHQVHIDADSNRISVDAARGGCIGETLATFKMMRVMDGAPLLNYEEQMAMDEVRHAALAWASVKWMTAQRADLDIVSEGWWVDSVESFDDGEYASARETIATILQ